MDTVTLRDLRFDLVVGRDAWRRPGKAQPVLITISLQPSPNFEGAALEDDVGLTLDYGKLYKDIDGKVKDKLYGNVQGLMLDLVRSIEGGYKLLNIDIVLPKALLEATSGLYYHLRIDRSVPESIDAKWSLAVKGISAFCIVGVNPHERQFKQRLAIDLILGGVQPLDLSIDPNALADSEVLEMTKHLVERIEGSSYQTLEALATAIAQIATMEHGQPIVTVVVEKPNAIATVGTAAIQLTRSRTFFENKDFWKVKRP